VLYKLKECGKIEQSDVVDFLKEFDALDYDHSGTLCHSDVLLSQQSSDSEQSAPAA
jgi:potassium channel subfamily K